MDKRTFLRRKRFLSEFLKKNGSSLDEFINLIQTKGFDLIKEDFQKEGLRGFLEGNGQKA